MLYEVPLVGKPALLPLVPPPAEYRPAVMSNVPLPVLPVTALTNALVFAANVAPPVSVRRLLVPRLMIGLVALAVRFNALLIVGVTFAATAMTLELAVGLLK